MLNNRILKTDFNCEMIKIVTFYYNITGIFLIQNYLLLIDYLLVLMFLKYWELTEALLSG